MTISSDPAYCAYEVPLDALPPEADAVQTPAFLSQGVLLSNIRWFCRLRWCVVAVFVIFGLAAQDTNIRNFWGLRQPGLWPFLIAAALVIANLAYTVHARFSVSRITAEINLLTQIAVDLIVLTFVVYFVGSTDTHIPFVYLFHIVLSSIFFTGRVSFLILLFSGLLFGVCLLFERYSGIPSGGIFLATPFAGLPKSESHWIWVHYGSVLGIWTGVWYLAGHLAQTVRKQDSQLAQANQRLEAAIKERTRHMLWTTHALKSPFAAIAANAQLLLSGICGTLSEEAAAIVDRINRRCSRLSKEIQEMLQLANLESDSQHAAECTTLDLAEILHGVLRQIAPAAERRSITIVGDIETVWVNGVNDHFVMLFENLISNAVNYSYDGGQVEVSARRTGNDTAVVSVIDHGIGIASEKLPRIFEEYYRTKEAAAHNKESSGLGMAIVKHIVQLYRLRLCIQSSPQSGTRLDLYFKTIGQQKPLS